MHYSTNELHCTSGHLEKTALERYRQLAPMLSSACRLHREIWDRSTMLCLDCADCPQALPLLQSQLSELLAIADSLSLSSAISLRLGRKPLAWQTHG